MTRRLVAPALCVLAAAALLAACSSSSSPAPAAGAASSPARASASSASAARSSASPSPSCTLPDDRDVIVWYRVPGVQDSAQELGETDLANCTPTVETIISTAPTGDGYCTAVGWADQNGGYNADATPAPPLKHIIEEAGGSC